jgi:hypothetical protein
MKYQFLRIYVEGPIQLVVFKPNYNFRCQGIIKLLITNQFSKFYIPTSPFDLSPLLKAFFSKRKRGEKR